MAREQLADPYNLLDSSLHTEGVVSGAAPVSLNEQPELYPVLADVEAFRVARDRYSGLQESTMQAEARYLKLDPITDDVAFVSAHQRLLEDYSTNLRAELSRAKQELTSDLVHHLGDRTLSDGTSLRDTIEQRLEQVTEERLIVNDVLRPGDEARADNSLGSYRARTRTVHAGVLEWLACEELSPGRGLEKFVDLTLKHELLHALFASATVFNEDGALYSGVRNGLRLALPISQHEQGIRGVHHAQWLNEATIESVRTLLTGERSTSYLREVLLLETLEELAPGLRDELVVAAIDPEGPAAALAKVEMLLGPTGTGIEDAAEEFDMLPIGRLRHVWLDVQVMRCFHRSMRSRVADAYAKAEARWLGLPAGTYTSADFDAAMQALPLGGSASNYAA